MEAKDVTGLIGKEVWWTAKEVLADIVSYEKGWVTIKTDDDQEHKVRAKDIVLMDSDDDIVEGEGGEITVEEGPKDPTEALSVPAFDPSKELDCGCGNQFIPPRSESFRCPSCGRWFRVRLHPDMDRYVKGMAATASGRDTVDIDDHVAEILRGYNLDALYRIVCEELHKLDEKAWFSKAMTSKFRNSGMECDEFLADRYATLNPGMQRMNLGNLLRGAMQRDTALKAIEERKNGAENGK